MYAEVHIILGLADLWNAPRAYARTSVLELLGAFWAPVGLSSILCNSWVANYFSTFGTDDLREALVLCSVRVSHCRPHVNASSVLLPTLVYNLQLELAPLYLIVYLLPQFLSFLGARCVDTVYIWHLVNCLIE